MHFLLREGCVRGVEIAGEEGYGDGGGEVVEEVVEG